MNFEYTYEYDYPLGSGGDALAAAILSIYLIVLTVALVFVLVDYIFHSIGLYTIGKRMGKNNPWLAFIPFARDYFHGELAGEIPLRNRKIKNPGIWNLILPIAYGVISGVFTAIIVGVIMFGAFAAGTGSGGIGVGSIMAILLLYLVMIILLLVYAGIHSTLTILINTQIFGNFTTHNMAIVHSVLSSIIPFYGAFCMFAMRNKPFNPGMEPRLTPPEPPVPPVPPVRPEGEPEPPVPPVHPEGEPEPPVPPESPENP